MKQMGRKHHVPREYCRRPQSMTGKVMSGLIIVAVGLVLLARQLGVYFPEWLFTWEMLLIVMGVYVGAKHSFKNAGWLILVLIGGLFMVDDFYPEANFGDFVWPVLIIFVGLVMIFKPRRSRQEWKQQMRQWKEMRDHRKEHFEEYINVNEAANYAENRIDENKIEVVAVFGGVKKNVISKEFKGGEITNVFGGSEINMVQADFEGRIELEVVNFFGGTKLIIPAHWEVYSETVAVLGGIEDKRPPAPDNATDNKKILVIRGTSIFGGIDIRSF